jgi:multicomponent K+:H+ antiporter subunit G
MDVNFQELAVSVFLLIGGAFTLLGSIGLARLPDFFTRLHGPTKATTLGVGAVVIASVLHAIFNDYDQVLRALGITIFLFISAPITASLLASAAKADARRNNARQESPRV